MTKKEIKNFKQEEINAKASAMYEKALDELRTDYLDCMRLRTCQALVMETKNYYILRSYGTYVACIEKSSDTLVDVLRTVFGYTATSCQHISKFEKDYCAGKWNCANRLRSYYVG